MGWRCWDSSFPLFPSSSLLLPPPPSSPNLLLPPFFPLTPSFYPLPPHPLLLYPSWGDTKGSSSPKKIKPGRAEAGTEPSPPVPHPWPFTRLPPGTNSSPSHPVSLLFPPSSPPRQTAPSPHSSAYASAARVAAINQDHTTASCLHGKLHGQSQPPRCALAAVGRRPVPICTTALCWEIVRVVRAKPSDTSGTKPPPPSPLLPLGAFPFYRGGWGW